MKELLLNMLSSTLETVGEGKLVEILQDLYEKDRNTYLAALLGGRAFALAVAPLAEKTKSPIDNVILSSINDAISTSAANNGIDLDFEESSAKKA